MTRKHLSYLVFGVLTVAMTGLCLYLVLHRRAVKLEYSPEPDGGALPSQTRETSTDPEEVREVPEAVFPEEGFFEPQPTPEPRKVSNKRPDQPKEAPLQNRIMPPRRSRPEARGKRSVPAHPSAVYPSQERVLTRLCGGNPISQCTKVNFTQTGFALLILDILGLEVPEGGEEAFDILESIHIRPVDGWATAKPMGRITPQEMEEVRCSISLAFEDGLISVGPSIVTAGVNRFCEAWELSQQVPEDAGPLRADRPRLVETGYQGGGDGVTSPPY